MSLSALRSGEQAEVVEVRAKGLVRRRLLDLGFVPGTVVWLERTAPFGDPRSYRIRSSSFALRDREAEQVTVRRLRTGSGVQG